MNLFSITRKLSKSHGLSRRDSVSMNESVEQLRFEIVVLFIGQITLNASLNLAPMDYKL